MSPFERDRRAIWAMVGFQGAFTPDRPCQSWGTEKVHVLEDKGRSIVLQHLLVMSMAGKTVRCKAPS